MTRHKAFLWITRPWWSLVHLPMFLAGITLGRGGFPPISILILGTSGFFFGKAAASVLNDVFDYRVDERIHPDRPIPQGIISRNEAFLFGVMLLILFMIIGIILTITISSMRVFWVYLVSAFVIFFHFWKGKQSRVPILATLGTTSLAAFVSLGGYILSNNIDKIGIVLFVLVWAWDFAHDSCSSIRDVNGDGEFGILTPAVVLGRQGAAILSLIAFVVAVLLAVVLRSLANLGSLFTMILLASALLTLAHYGLYFKYQEPQRLYVALSWFHIIFAIGICLDVFARSAGIL